MALGIAPLNEAQRRFTTVEVPKWWLIGTGYSTVVMLSSTCGLMT